LSPRYLGHPDYRSGNSAVSCRAVYTQRHSV
jgi:hypothetical protein